MEGCHWWFTGVRGLVRVVVLFETNDSDKAFAVQKRLVKFLAKRDCNHELLLDGEESMVLGKDGDASFFVIAALHITPF
jgi:hypothetical protein